MATLAERVQAFRNPAGTKPAGVVDTARPRRKPQPPRPRSLGGARARATTETGQGFGYENLWGMATRSDRDIDWRALDLDDRTLERIDTADLIEMMADLSPEISAALWYFIRFCNPGWKVTVLRPNGKHEPYAAGQAAVDKFLAELSKRHGAVDVVLDQLFMSGFMRGAFFAELVLDEKGRRPLDLAVVDPHTAEYRQVDDPVLGLVWRLGQLDGNTWIPIDAPTARLPRFLTVTVNWTPAAGRYSATRHPTNWS